MATNDEVKAYIETLLANYDSNIDLSPDSSAQSRIVDPLVAYIGDDPLDTPVEKFLRARIAENYSQLEQEGGGPLPQLLLGPARVILGPILREITLIKERQRADNLSLHTEESLQAKLSNLFLEMNDGQYATGTARIYFESPRLVDATTDKMFSTAEGLNYFPNGDQSITAANMLYNREGAYYYFDIQVISQRPGAQYNAAAGNITLASGFPGYVRVTNNYSLSNGVDAETIGEFWLRASQYPTEVSLNTLRGITAIIRDGFAGLTDLAVIGYGDEEMVRDMIVGGGYGSPMTYAESGTSTISLVEDGDYDLYSPIIFVNTIDFVSLIGPVGTYTTPRAALDVMWVDLDGVTQIDTFDIIEIVDANTVTLDEEIAIDPTAGDPIPAITLRGKTIEISDIPGGFADPDVSPPVETPDSIHVGGADEPYVASYERAAITTSTEYVDIYDAESSVVHASTVGAGEATINSPWTEIVLTDISSSEDPLPTALKAGTVIKIFSSSFATHDGYYRIGAVDATNYFSGSIAVDIVELDGSAITLSSTAATADYEILDYTTGLEKGYVLNLTSGEPGAYKVVKYTAGSVSPHSLPLVRMLTAYEFQSTSVDNAAKLYDDIELNLKEPKNIRAEGTDLVGLGGTYQFSSAGSTNFTAKGVVAGDVLRVLNSDAAADYTVSSVAGPGSSILVIEEQVPSSVSGASYQVFSALDGPELPLLRLVDVGLLDSSLSPIGVEIPCGDPLAFVSGEFSNFGEGVTYETSRAVIGIVSNNDGSSGLNVDGWTLRLRIVYPNGITLDDEVTFSGVNPMSLTTIATQINTQFNGAYAYTITVGAQQFLGIRPIGGTRVDCSLTPSGSDARTPLGIEDIDCSQYSNGIFFLEAVPLMLSYRDFVYVKSGPNTGTVAMWTSMSPTAAPTKLLSLTDFWPDPFARVALGMPSLGRVRAYFKDPTYFFIGAGAQVVFDDDGINKTYIVNPADDATILPAYPTTARPRMDTPTASTTLTDSDATLLSDLIQDADDNYRGFGETAYGDQVSITYRKCWFDKQISGTLSLAGEWLRMAVGDSQVQTVSFINGMSPQDVADYINAVFTDVASIVEEGGSYWLVIESEELIVDVTYSPGAFTTALGDFIPTTNTNKAANYNVMSVISVDTETTMTLEAALTTEQLTTAPDPAPTVFGPDVQYEVRRPGAYHIGPTEMESNTDGAYYYAEFDMLSYGVGDEFNITSELYGTPLGYICKGYRLSAGNDATSLSPTEDLGLTITNAFYETGVETRASQNTVTASNNIQLDYDYSAMVQDVHSFVRGDSERVLVSSLMGKHMLPHYVGTTIYYRGGPSETEAKDLVESAVETVYSGQTLEISDIIAVLSNKGATYIQLPVQLYVLYQSIDRSMWLRIVENTNELSRLACFFADLDKITLTRLS
jgi:hypothetical protein